MMSINETLFFLYMVVVAAVYASKTYLSPEIKDAAKEAATKKALGLISRWLS